MGLEAVDQLGGWRGLRCKLVSSAVSDRLTITPNAALTAISTATSTTLNTAIVVAVTRRRSDVLPKPTFHLEFVIAPPVARIPTLAPYAAGVARSPPVSGAMR